MADITFNTSDFDNKITKFELNITKSTHKALNMIADEVLRLSSFEVPHDTGLLQNSGHVEDHGDEVIVGYNKVYAARLHEHPEYRFQKGRKGKYLEDPIKRNIVVFTNLVKQSLTGELL
jgi:hypothetical protein